MQKERVELYNQLKQRSAGSGSLRVQVYRLYTDIDGKILDKNDVLVPAVLQTDLPVYMLGNFDRMQGFKTGQQILPPFNVAAQFLFTYVHSAGQVPYLFATGFNNLNDRLVDGDVITVFTDSMVAPTCYAFIVQTCQYGGLGAIIANTEVIQEDGTRGLMKAFALYYQNDNRLQFDEQLRIVRMDNLGLYKADVLDNKIAQNPNVVFLNDFIEFPIDFFVTQYVGIYTRMLFATNSMIFNYKISR